jgi:hypothetical protein
VEKYGIFVQATADNTIHYMHLACSVTSATDTHLPYAMIIVFGYMKAPNGILDLYCCLVKNLRVSKLLN